MSPPRRGQRGLPEPLRDFAAATLGQIRSLRDADRWDALAVALAVACLAGGVLGLGTASAGLAVDVGLLLVGLACFFLLPRIRELALASVGTITSLVITLFAVFVVAMLFGRFASMGMPGLFWHERAGVQFRAAVGVTIYLFWMLYLLFLSRDDDGAAWRKRIGTSFVDCFWHFAPLLLFVLALPACFPRLRGWEIGRGLAPAWLGGVAVGVVAAWLVARSRPVSWAMERLVWPSGLSPGLGGTAGAPPQAPVDGSTAAKRRARVAAVALVALFFVASRVMERMRPEWLAPVLPAGVSLCVLLATVATLLMAAQGLRRWNKVAVGFALAGALVMNGARDYKVRCRDLAAPELGLYPTWAGQYDRFLAGHLPGFRSAAEPPKVEAPERPVSLTAYQQRLFDRGHTNDAHDQARNVREAWLTNWVRRLQPDPSVGPRPVVVVVCASGGALRAALWTQVVLDAMDRKLPRFGQRVRLMTGASGGMLGVARYLVWRHELGDREEADGHRMPGISAPDPPDYLEAIARQIALHDVVPDMFLPMSRRNRGDVLEDEFATFERRQLARDSDPSERHALRKGITMSFEDFREAEIAGMVPSVIFSPMLAEDGRRILVSNLPLSDLATTAKGFPLLLEDRDGVVQANLKKDRRADTEVDLELPQVASTPAIEFFELFGPKTEQVRERLRLVSAVRMSATFPYVTPAVTLPTDPPRHVVDAGYYDNYGVNLAARWIESHAEWLAENTGGVLVVQIRAFRNERALKLYDPDAVRPGADAASTAGGWNGIDLPGMLAAGFSEWFVPLMGAAQAQNRSMFFRNDEQLLALGNAFTAATGDEHFLKTVIFTCDTATPESMNDASATLNWYMSKSEFDDIKRNMKTLDTSNNTGRDRNALRLDAVERWWADRGQPSRPAVDAAPAREPGSGG